MFSYKNVKLRTRIEFLNIKNFVCRRLPRNFLYYKNDLKSDLNIFIKGKYIRFPYFRGVLKRGDYPLFFSLFTVVVLMHAFTLGLRAVNTKIKKPAHSCVQVAFFLLLVPKGKKPLLSRVRSTIKKLSAWKVGNFFIACPWQLRGFLS